MHSSYLAFLLHAHLPFVRNPEDKNFLEELWYYEALTETYIPLLQKLRTIAAKGNDFGITLSLSPTLLAMFHDPLLQNRYCEYLERRIKLAEKEIHRNHNQTQFQNLARFYLDNFKNKLDYYHSIQFDIIKQFQNLYAQKIIDLWTTSATHAYFPLHAHQPKAVETQIKVGIQSFEYYLGFKPEGFWIPECGYYPTLDQILLNEGIRYTILETHSVLYGEPRPYSANYLPVKTPNGLIIFPRDIVVSQKIWSNQAGYPGNSLYREFYSDIGQYLDYHELEPCVHPDGFKINTGIKYQRITDKNSDHKEPYEPEMALEQIKKHSDDLAEKISVQSMQLKQFLKTPSITTAPFDAELFGHWWYEGPEFIYQLANLPESKRFYAYCTFKDFIKQYPVSQTCTPSPSSWGMNGYSEMWLNNTNDWIYRPLHQACNTMSQSAEKYSACQHSASTQRILDQMAKELLLAQSSDWPFIIRTKTTVQYAINRIKEHLCSFKKLYEQLNSDNRDLTFLEQRENQYTLFPGLSYKIYAQ